MASLVGVFSVSTYGITQPIELQRAKLLSLITLAEIGLVGQWLAALASSLHLLMATDSMDMVVGGVGVLFLLDYLSSGCRLVLLSPNTN